MGLDGLDDDSVQVWDVPNRTRIVNFDVMAADETLVLSPFDGSVSVSGNNELVTVDYPEEGLNRWDLRKQDPRPTTEASPGWLSPDGNWLLTEWPDGALKYATSARTGRRSSWRCVNRKNCSIFTLLRMRRPSSFGSATE